MQTVIWVERQSSTKRDTGTDVQRDYKTERRVRQTKGKGATSRHSDRKSKGKIQINRELETDKQSNVHREKRNR
jgi:hypothetical protein